MALGPIVYAEPGDGGHTLQHPGWICAAAYAGLPERLKRAVEGRRAIFSYVKQLAGYQGTDRVISEEATRETPPAPACTRWCIPTL
jgi:hypothetical protein